MQEALLVVHILAAAAWIGGGLFATTSFSTLARQIGVKQVGSLDEAIGSRYFGTSVVVLVLSGIALVLNSDAYGWGDTFVSIGLGVVVVDGALQGTLFGPRAKKAYASEDTRDFLGVMRLGAVSSIILFVLAVWAMVVKIGAG